MKNRIIHLVILLLLPFVSTAAYLPPTFLSQGGVVSAQHLATKAGLDILKSGGNAIDAAVAVGYVLAVVHPCCGNIGGGGFMLIHLKNGNNTVIDFRETAPLAITRQKFLDSAGNVNHQLTQKSYLAVAVPGTVMGLNLALQKYGSLPLTTVMSSAIQLAKDGFILNNDDIKILHQNTQDFKQQATVAAIFLKDNHVYQSGDRLIQLQLSKTLKLISVHGATAFYNGPIADKIVAASSAHHGVLQKNDFSRYQAIERPVVTCHYHDYLIITTPPPGSGITICEILNVLQKYPLNHWGYHSSRSIHYNLEAMRYAFIDHNQRLGDPAFVNIATHQLLSDRYAAHIRSKIKPDHAGSSSSINNTHSFESAHTTHFSVVDARGNAVAVTYTINSFFGAGIIAADTGFFLNNDVDDFTISLGSKNMFGLQQGRANLIAPGKRPLSSMSPTMIFKDNQLFMVIGAAGGPTIITTLVETIENVIDYGMDINTAINEPRYHFQATPDLIYLEPYALSADTISLLKRMAYHIHWGSIFNTPYWGQANVIVKGKHPGNYYGATDNRRGGSALGY